MAKSRRRTLEGMSAAVIGAWLAGCASIQQTSESAAKLRFIKIINISNTEKRINIEIRKNSEKIFQSEYKVKNDESTLTIDSPINQTGPFAIDVSTISGNGGASINIDRGNCVGVLIEIQENSISTFLSNEENCSAT